LYKRVVQTAALIRDRPAGVVSSATCELSASRRRCACSYALNSGTLNEPITRGNAPRVPSARPAIRKPRTLQVGVVFQTTTRRRQFGLGTAMYLSSAIASRLNQIAFDLSPAMHGGSRGRLVLAAQELGPRGGGTAVDPSSTTEGTGMERRSSVASASIRHRPLPSHARRLARCAC